MRAVYLGELLLPISIGPHEAVRGSHVIEIWGPTDRMRREIELWAPWMPEEEAQELLDEIDLMPMWQRKPIARTLGERLQVTYGERARLRLRTIGPCDMTEAAMALIRKQKKRQRERLRRVARGAETRATYLASRTRSRERPWERDRISRATWYRRQHETGPCQVNLIKTEHALVSKEELGSKAGECGRVSTPTPAGLTETRIEEFERLLEHWIPVNEMDWLGWSSELAAEAALGAG